MKEIKSSGTWRSIKLILWCVEILFVMVILCIEMYVYYRSLMNSNNVGNLEMMNKGNTIHSPKPKKDPKKAYHLTRILPVISYIFYILVGVLTIFDIGNMFSCKTGGILPLASYVTAKSFMYFLFIYRLHIVYDKSAFKYNIRILIGLFVSILIYGIGNSIANAFSLDVSSVNINGIRFCVVTIDTPVLIVGALYDLGIATICCILFVRPLRILTKNNKHLNETNTHIKELGFKYTILTFVAVSTTTLIYIAIAIIDLVDLGGIDIMINALCLMMFNSHYHHIYKILCCCPINIIKKTSCPNKTENTSDV